MTLLDRIKAQSPRLTEADHRLIGVLTENSAEAVFLSATQLAERVNVHEAAATRLAQKLGYKGYPEMRADLQRGMMESQDAANRIRRSLEKVAHGDYLADLIGSEISALENLRQCIAQKDIDRAADMIVAAERIYLFGQGHAQSVISFLQRRLDRFGLTTIALQGRGRDIAERVVSLDKKDIVVALAFRKQPHSYAPLVDLCRRRKTPVVLISDLAGPMMRPEADLMLAAPRGRSGSEFQTPTIPFAIVNAVLLTIAGRHKKRMMGALENLTELFKSFE